MIENINIEYNNKNTNNNNNKNKNKNNNNNNNESRYNTNNYKGGFQSIDKNNISNINTYNRNTKNVRRLTNKYSKQNLQQNNSKRRLTKINLSGGGTTEDDIKITKRRKIMDLLDIKNLQPIKIKPPTSIIDRILASLFYGYSNNIACYSGNSNKYYVKFSSKKGSIESTSFDFINKKPDFIIYNEFSINKDMGTNGAKLSMVSEITSNHFGNFIDIHELRKKIKDL